jgi:hypothetical protein
VGLKIHPISYFKKEVKNMSKGYTTPTNAPKKKMPVMPVKSPMKSDFKAPDITNKIPAVRPTSMRNLGPWKGLK